MAMVKSSFARYAPTALLLIVATFALGPTSSDELYLPMQFDEIPILFKVNSHEPLLSQLSRLCNDYGISVNTCNMLKNNSLYLFGTKPNSLMKNVPTHGYLKGVAIWSSRQSNLSPNVTWRTESIEEYARLACRQGDERRIIDRSGCLDRVWLQCSQFFQRFCFSCKHVLPPSSRQAIIEVSPKELSVEEASVKAFNPAPIISRSEIVWPLLAEYFWFFSYLKKFWKLKGNMQGKWIIDWTMQNPCAHWISIWSTLFLNDGDTNAQLKKILSTVESVGISLSSDIKQSFLVAYLAILGCVAGIASRLYLERRQDELLGAKRERICAAIIIQEAWRQSRQYCMWHHTVKQKVNRLKSQITNQGIQLAQEQLLLKNHEMLVTACEKSIAITKSACRLIGHEQLDLTQKLNLAFSVYVSACHITVMIYPTLALPKQLRLGKKLWSDHVDSRKIRELAVFSIFFSVVSATYALFPGLAIIRLRAVELSKKPSKGFRAQDVRRMALGLKGIIVHSHFFRRSERVKEIVERHSIIEKMSRFISDDSIASLCPTLSPPKDLLHELSLVTRAA